MTEYHSEYHHPPYPEGYLLERKVKPITEEQRQALIVICENSIEGFNADLTQGSTESPHKTVIHRMIYEIALASLTAGPQFQIQKISYNNNVWIDVDIKNEAMAQNIHGYRCRQLYTATPVPVINFPNPHDIPDGYDLDSCMATVQWYQSEVKRLNGQGE